jgi:hypothetical protein
VLVPRSRRGTSVAGEEPTVYGSTDDDLHPAAVEEEHRLEDHNEVEDARALFGGSVAINIDNDDDVPGVAVGGQMGICSTSPTPTDTSTVATTSSKRPPRSKVWQDFDELTHLVNGKRVRYGTICKYCVGNG